MITAAQAREKTDNSSVRITALMETISKQIEEAAEGGRNYIYLDFALNAHGYNSIFSGKDILSSGMGVYVTVWKMLEDARYHLRVVDHASDLKYFTSIYGDPSMLERTQKDRFSIKVTW